MHTYLVRYAANQKNLGRFKAYAVQKSTWRFIDQNTVLVRSPKRFPVAFVMIYRRLGYSGHLYMMDLAEPELFAWFPERAETALARERAKCQAAISALLKRLAARLGNDHQAESESQTPVSRQRQWSQKELGS